MIALNRLAAGQAAAVAEEVAALMANPAGVGPRLEQSGYQVTAMAGGFLALPPNAEPTALVMAPLHQPATATISGLFISGPQVAQCSAIVATLRAATETTALLFPTSTIRDVSVLPNCPRLSLEGGVVPRIWPGCFGSVDLLIRCIGRQPQRDVPNYAVNALEGAVPILAALQAASSFPPGRRRNSGSSDAPLTPRLSVVAAHGGTRGSPPPTLFDIVVTRRYAPGESVAGVTAEIEAVVRAAASPNLRVEISVLGNTSPVPDPMQPQWSREARALVSGWNWPQTPFRASASLLPNAALLGGLEEAGSDPTSPKANVSVEEVEALRLSLFTYLTSVERGVVSAVRTT